MWIGILMSSIKLFNYKSKKLLLPVDLRFEPVGVWLPGEDDAGDAELSVTVTISLADFSRSLCK